MRNRGYLLVGRCDGGCMTKGVASVARLGVTGPVQRCRQGGWLLGCPVSGYRRAVCRALSQLSSAAAPKVKI